MLPALLQVLSSDVHHMTANSRRRVQSQVQVLLLSGSISDVKTVRQLQVTVRVVRLKQRPQSHLDGEGCELLLVDGSLVDGVRHRQVDHLTNGRKTRIIFTTRF